MRRCSGVFMSAALLCAGCFDDPEVIESGGDGSSGTTTTTTTSGLTTSTATSSATTSSSTSSDATTGTTTVDPTTGASSGPPATSGSTGGDRPGVEINCNVFDDFDRMNSAAVGGDFTQDSSVFSILDNRVQGTFPNDGTGFHDWVVRYNDTFADIAAQIEFTVDSFDPRNEPALWARIQSDSVGDQFLRGYALVANSEPIPGSTPPGDSLCLMRFDGNMEGPSGDAVWCGAEMEELSTGTYRLTIRVEGGGSQISLQGSLERANPMGSWDVVDVVEAIDDSANAISSAGHTGFGGGEGGNDFIDNYWFDNYCHQAGM